MNASKRYGTNDALKSPPLLHKMKQIGKSGPADVVDFDDFQGESQPMHEEGIILLNFLVPSFLTDFACYHVFRIFTSFTIIFSEFVLVYSI